MASGRDGRTVFQLVAAILYFDGDVGSIAMLDEFEYGDVYFDVAVERWLNLPFVIIVVLTIVLMIIAH
jgi:hypothetical protein